MKAVDKAELQDLAKAQLLALFAAKKDKRVYVSLISVARSGMSRKVKLFTVNPETERLDAITYRVADLLDYTNREGAITLGGCGMDMGFAIVYDLSLTLYKGEEQAGYILKHQWL